MLLHTLFDYYYVIITLQSSQSDVAGDFPCLDNELESCRLKRKTLSRLRVSLEDLRNIDNQGECQDRCESAVGKKGKRLEQCMCLCNYYNVCLGSIGNGYNITSDHVHRGLVDMLFR